jgi:hypothetical protein
MSTVIHVTYEGHDACDTHHADVGNGGNGANATNVGNGGTGNRGGHASRAARPLDTIEIRNPNGTTT